eukprot:2156943-Rhodomonas_salina.1
MGSSWKEIADPIVTDTGRYMTAWAASGTSPDFDLDRSARTPASCGHQAQLYLGTIFLLPN